MKRIAYLFVLISLLQIAYAPPTPHVVRGVVRISSGADVPAGTIVAVNDTVSGSYALTYTTGPSGATGRYAATIVGENGDLIVVRSWNATHWGQANKSLTAAVTIIDVTLNMTRSSETNTTLISPANHTSYLASTGLQISARISLLGADATGCVAILSFSQPYVFNLSGAETYSHSIGDINRGNSVVTSWDVFAAGVGTTDITVMSSCASDGFMLENLYSDTAVNISVYDNDAPVVRALYPYNHSRINNPIVFKYNVTDLSPVLNCSLYINNIFQDVQYNPERSQILNFTRTVDTKTNEWYVICYENTPLERSGTTGIFNLTINSLPSLLVSVQDPIDLFAGSQRSVSCNGTATDLDWGGDVVYVNATLYNTDLGQGPASPDNNSLHYTDPSCILGAVSGDTREFNCTFQMEYYALNGTWQCSVTARDLVNGTNISLFDTEVNQLVALGTQQQVIDYGNLGLGDESSADYAVNVTNYGNVDLDLELFAYALLQDDNLSMVCGTGTIPAAYERYDILSDRPYLLMSPLGISSSPSSVNFNLKPRTQATSASKHTYWKMGIPTFGVSGNCQGKVVFTAVIN